MYLFSAKGVAHVSLGQRPGNAPGIQVQEALSAESAIQLVRNTSCAPQNFAMPIPETTSAETLLERYIGGKCLVACSGEAWREIKASTYLMPSMGEERNIPSVSEPVLIWVTSGEVEVQDRETNGPWLTSRVKKGYFFLVAGGAPYDCRWKTLTSEPFEVMHVLVGLPLLERALEEVFGADAIHAQLRDVSSFSDASLGSLVEQLHGELMRPKASPLYVQSVGQAIAIHLARNYAVATSVSHGGSSSLPGYKVQQITHWMAEHVAEDFNLASLAAQAGLSKFHFDRLFKRAMGVSPSRYHVNLRMNAARRLLRETKKSVTAIAIEVGYSNPSHFAQVFRRETVAIKR